jgi:1,4-alpha-glucan branching enzyme
LQGDAHETNDNLIAQSLNLAKNIEYEDYADFSIKRFKDSIEAFTAVFDSLGSNTVSTEWLTTLEMRDSFFPWMNYRIFSKKK